jgi:hypothetical protein
MTNTPFFTDAVSPETLLWRRRSRSITYWFTAARSVKVPNRVYSTA